MLGFYCLVTPRQVIKGIRVAPIFRARWEPRELYNDTNNNYTHTHTHICTCTHTYEHTQRHVDKHKDKADRQASRQTDRKVSNLVFSPSQPARLYQADWRDETVKPVVCDKPSQ